MWSLSELADGLRRMARNDETSAAYWAALARIDRGIAADRHVDDVLAEAYWVEHREQTALRLAMQAHQKWKQAWALEHRVEHEDCRANEELARVCRTSRLKSVGAFRKLLRRLRVPR